MKKKEQQAIVAGIFLCGSLFALLSATNPCAAEEIRTIETRPGVTLNLLFLKPDAVTKQVLLLFPGGSGAKHFGEKGGKIWRGKNFLLRATPDFVKKGLAVAVVDAPSDHRLGMEDAFRTSAGHTDDIDKAVHFLAGQGYEAVYLVGTSRGTISVAYLGGALRNPHIRGIVLTSSMGYNRYLSWLPLDKVAYPVLIVHHKHDGCAVTTYPEAQALAGKFTGSPRVDFMGVEGGAPPQSDPCEAMSAHGYLGIEQNVVDIISEWVAKTP